MTKILIKRLSKEVSLPKYETKGSSGMDLAANLKTGIDLKPGETVIVPTGLAVSIPNGFEAQIRPRSGLAAKKKISVLNTPGTIAVFPGSIFILVSIFAAKSIPEDPLVSYLGRGTSLDSLLINIFVIH